MRQTEFDIDPLFTRRWSPRAMSGEPIAHEELMALFEAARWAPSANNNQPWRFVYARRDTPEWERFFDLLAPGNQPWCTQAAVLVVVVASETFAHNGQPSRTHAFDAGAAWQSLALQGTIVGLVVHGMQGFDYDRAAQVIALPEGHAVQCMVAIGKPGHREDLPEPYRGREEPSTRRPLSEIVFEGRLLQPVPANV